MKLEQRPSARRDAQRQSGTASARRHALLGQQQRLSVDATELSSVKSAGELALVMGARTRERADGSRTQL
jgi:hypothetical protein